MCGTGNWDNAFDSVLAVYQDSADPTNCACPGDPGFQRIGLAQDESCNGIVDGSGGILTQRVTPGECITIRAGGVNDAGRGTLKIRCQPICTVVKPPEADPAVLDVGYGTRNRYLSFVGKDLGETLTAVRVTFKSLPPPHDVYNGDQWWVGEPFEVTQASGSAESTPPPTFWAATLTCDEPYYDDWSRYGVVHVFDAGIINSGEYHIQKIADDCNPDDEDNYSDPTWITMSTFGDVCGGNCDAPPQGTVDFVDISCIVIKFKNEPGAMCKTRADITGNGPGDPLPNRKVDFVDIGACVDAFRGTPPPKEGPSQRCPPQ
jgi:hypothetical protein